MRNLINFLFRYSAWILFIIYTVASCVLLFRNSPYQHHVFLTSANSVVSGVYSASSSVTAYFNLKGINEDLQRRNTDLELEVLNLKRTIDFYREKEYADSVPVDSSLQRYSFITAHVINNTITKSHNYITLNKGTEDGLRPEMGVVGPKRGCRNCKCCRTTLSQSNIITESLPAAFVQSQGA